MVFNILFAICKVMTNKLYYQHLLFSFRIQQASLNQHRVTKKSHQIRNRRSRGLMGQVFGMAHLAEDKEVQRNMPSSPQISRLSQLGQGHQVCRRVNWFSFLKESLE